jgi:putative YphP/YqiW family bacilliredoxin
MPYSEILIKPMREVLTRIGVEETRSPEQVEQAIGETKGTLLVVVNSVCGCAAGKAVAGFDTVEHLLAYPQMRNEERSFHDRNAYITAGVEYSHYHN